jgi:hypothetical protein
MLPFDLFQPVSEQLKKIIVCGYNRSRKTELDRRHRLVKRCDNSLVAVIQDIQHRTGPLARNREGYTPQEIGNYLLLQFDISINAGDKDIRNTKELSAIRLKIDFGRSPDR